MDNDKLFVGEPSGELRPSSMAERDQMIELLEQRVSRIENALRLNPFTCLSMFLADLQSPTQEER